MSKDKRKRMKYFRNNQVNDKKVKEIVKEKLKQDSNHILVPKGHYIVRIAQMYGIEMKLNQKG